MIVVQKKDNEPLKDFVISTRRMVRRYRRAGGTAPIFIVKPEAVYKAYWPGLTYLMIEMSASKCRLPWNLADEQRFGRPH